MKILKQYWPIILPILVLPFAHWNWATCRGFMCGTELVFGTYTFGGIILLVWTIKTLWKNKKGAVTPSWAVIAARILLYGGVATALFLYIMFVFGDW